MGQPFEDEGDRVVGLEGPVRVVDGLFVFILATGLDCR